MPTRYVTTQQQSINSTAQKNVHIAHMDCSNLRGAEVVVCAEIIYDWQLKYSMVILQLFNDHLASIRIPGLST